MMAEKVVKMAQCQMCLKFFHRESILFDKFCELRKQAHLLLAYNQQVIVLKPLQRFDEDIFKKIRVFRNQPNSLSM
jgi:hypothetical protein